MKPIYHEALKNMVAVSTLATVLSEQSDSRASAEEILATIIEEVDDLTSDFNQDVDIMIENLETGAWSAARGSQALESAQQDVRVMQQTFDEKYAVVCSMLHNLVVNLGLVQY